MDTILDRPRGLRLIGITQMAFGFFGLLASIGLVIASLVGNPSFLGMGLLYSVVIFLCVALPCLVIGNYVDDLRRNAVLAQVAYSAGAAVVAGYFLYLRGVSYHWTVPWFGLGLDVDVGNLAVLVVVTQTLFVLYLVTKWKSVAPPRGVHIERDKKKARILEQGLVPSPLPAGLVASDGHTSLTDEATRKIMDVRRVTTTEGMAILCSNCGGATPVARAEKDNTIVCQFCGVRLGLSSVFVPCVNHTEYLAATTCAVCGEHYCRMCLTAQEPPVDERWKGSSVFLCQRCFEGRYRPAVTTASLVIPIDKLFSKAGTRFSRVGSLYGKFLRAYGHIMRYVLQFAARAAASVGKGSHGNDNAGAVIIAIIIAIVAIPVLVGVAMLLAAIVIVPLLFYAGLIGVAIAAVRIIRRTDFLTLERARQEGIVLRRPAKKVESPLREESRPWENPREWKKEVTKAEPFIRR